MRISALKIVAPKPRSLWIHPSTKRVYEVLLIASFLSETLVVFRVRNGLGSLLQGNLARSLSDWSSMGLKQITRKEAKKHGTSIGQNPKNSWAVVSLVPLDQVRFSDELMVIHATGYEPHPMRSDDLPPEETWEYNGKTIKTGHVVGYLGKHTKVFEHVVGGATFEFREDARDAKASFVTERKLQKTTAAEHFGYEGSSY